MSSVCNSFEWQLIHRVILEPSGRKWELQQAGIRFEAKVLNVTFFFQKRTEIYNEEEERHSETENI